MPISSLVEFAEVKQIFTRSEGRKGGVTVRRAAKILALPERGGGLTHAKIFLVNLNNLLGGDS